MVIGDGLLANSFAKYKKNDKCVIFASGVSNSNETRNNEFLIEGELLQKYLLKGKSKLFVYFSTCSINNTKNIKTPYISHKIEMEYLIKQKSNNYLIFRLPQLIGKTKNKNTLLNYLYFSIINNVRFDIWDGTYRNLIDVEDVFNICDKIICQSNESNNSVKNIALKNNYEIMDVVKILETVLQKKACYNVIEKKENHKIEINDDVSMILKEMNIYNNDLHYLVNVIEKYYK